MIRFTKITHNVRKLFPELTKYFSQCPAVEFAYLFGSYGIGREVPLSDVDIAVYLAKEISPHEYFDIRLRMMADLFSLLHTYEVDLIILNQVDLYLAYQAIATREVLFERDPQVRIEFEARTVDRYLDSKPFRQIQHEYFVSQMQEGLIFGK